MMNRSIAGNVGKEPELRNAGSSQVLSFSVAVSGYDRQAKQKTTTWFRVSVWGKRGEQLSTLLDKGSRVACSGALEIGEYNGKAQLNLSVQDVTLLGSAQGGGGQGQSSSRPSPRGASNTAPAAGEFPDTGDDDIPF